MTDAEKKLLQAQHRLEEAQARNRVKERKVRTRRLIQEGAILEKCCRRCGRWSCLRWRDIFHESWENKSKFQMGGLRETGGLPLFSPEGRTYSPPDKSGSGIPFGARALCRGLYPLLQATSKGGARYGNLSYASQSCQPWFRTFRCRSFCLYELQPDVQ